MKTFLYIHFPFVSTCSKENWCEIFNFGVLDYLVYTLENSSKFLIYKYYEPGQSLIVTKTR